MEPMSLDESWTGLKDWVDSLKQAVGVWEDWENGGGWPNLRVSTLTAFLAVLVLTTGWIQEYFVSLSRSPMAPYPRSAHQVCDDSFLCSMPIERGRRRFGADKISLVDTSQSQQANLRRPARLRPRRVPLLQHSLDPAVILGLPRPHSRQGNDVRFPCEEGPRLAGQSRRCTGLDACYQLSESRAGWEVGHEGVERAA